MRVLLVEFRGHRTDVLSAYNVFIAAGYETHIALSEMEVISRKELPSTHLIPSSKEDAPNYKSAIGRAIAVISLIKRLNPDVVFINTLQGRDVEILIYRLFFSRKLKVAAIIHNADRLHKMKVKLLSKRIDLLLTLSPDVTKYIKNTFKIEAKTFQVIDFLSDYNYNYSKIMRDPSKVYIAITGGVDFKRRNYLWLIDQCIQRKDKLAGKIVFDIIGNAAGANGKKITELIEQNALNEIFELHYYRLSDMEYFARVDSCDAVISLTNNINYTFCKVHGSQVMATAFRKLYLQDEKYTAESMRPVSLIYNDNNFHKCLLDLHANRALANVRDNYEKVESVSLSCRLDLFKGF